MLALVTNLTLEWNSLQDEFEELQILGRNVTQQYENHLANLTRENNEIQRNITRMKSIVKSGFNCKAKIEAIEECLEYCSFPHGYDTCDDGPSRATYFQIYSKMSVGKYVVKVSYTRNNETDCELNLVLE
jgi:hypothetical protein